MRKIIRMAMALAFVLAFTGTTVSPVGCGEKTDEVETVCEECGSDPCECEVDDVICGECEKDPCECDEIAEVCEACGEEPCACEGEAPEDEIIEDEPTEDEG